MKEKNTDAEKTKITKEDLERMRALRYEIESLKVKPLKPTEVVIFYKDYRNNPKGIPKTDIGLDDGTEHMKRVSKMLNKKESERWRLIEALEEWIDSIDDPETRTIIRYYFRDGMSQTEIGAKLGYDQSTISIRIKSILRQLSYNS